MNLLGRLVGGFSRSQAGDDTQGAAQQGGGSAAQQAGHAQQVGRGCPGRSGAPARPGGAPARAPGATPAPPAPPTARRPRLPLQAGAWPALEEPPALEVRFDPDDPREAQLQVGHLAAGCWPRGWGWRWGCSGWGRWLGPLRLECNC
jgi:hypothetical protein